MKKITSVVVLLFIVMQHIYAVPAYPYPIKYALPDGSSLTITLKGDENVHWATSEDGYTLLMNQDGFYEYATLDENRNLILSGIQAKDMDARSNEDFAFLNTIERDLRYSAEQVHYQLQIYEFRNTMSKYLEEHKDSPPSRITGVVRFPLILVGFQGKPFTLQKSQFEALMNQPNYTIGGITGSVYDYFTADSYGQFDFQVDVFGPYTLSHAISYYDNNCSGGDSRKMASEAATAASNDGCNFALYDYNNDGYVDGMHIIFAGYGQEGGASSCQSIWSHSWSLNTTLILNGKRVYKFSCSPEFRGTSGTNITYMGVIAHELSHVLGLPDTYDTDYSSSNGQSIDLGAWCLMANGSWNDNGRTPPYHSAWCRNNLGWTTMQVLSSPATITIPNPQTQGMTYKVNTTTNNEYFLLENRQKIGWDAFVPASGMLIYHVDGNYSGWNNNCINCNPSHRGYYVKQAGCTGGASNCSTRTTDPYPYGSNNSFTDTSVPNSKSWAGANTAKPITEITHNTTNKTITFKFMGGDPSNANLTSLTVSSGTLTPAFSPNTTAYTVSVPNTVSTISITGVAEDANATVTGNVTNASLNIGINNFIITVTSQNNTTKSYTVAVTREVSANANLASLTVSSGTLTPAFSPSTTAYTVSVPNTVSTITITGVAEDANATVSGNVTNAPLNLGSNNFTITVTAPNNTTKNYSVTVSRVVNANANLASLTVSFGTLTPAFSPRTTAYTVKVPNAVSSITITGVAEDANATVLGNVENAPLNVGKNDFMITVTAQDLTTKNYTVTVTRAASSNADLISLTVSEGTLAPNFSPIITEYGVVVENAVSSISITCVTEDANATVSGNVTDAPLNVGENIFTITVTAEDNTTKIYSVTVIREDITQYEIVASVEENLGGKIEPNGIIMVNQGESILFEIFPDENYIIDSLIVDGIAINASETYEFEDITSNHTIVAKFLYVNSIENYENQKVNIYPNPASNEVTIESDNIIHNITVFSNDGKKILEINEINEQAYHISIQNFASGIYYLKINNTVKKLVKEN